MGDAIEDDATRHEQTYPGQRVDLRKRGDIQIELSADVTGAIYRCPSSALDRVANALQCIDGRPRASAASPALPSATLGLTAASAHMCGRVRRSYLPVEGGLPS
jgi:hypothetical protein